MERRLITLIYVFIAAAFLVLHVERVRTPRADVSRGRMLPLKVGEWRGTEVPIPADVYDALGASHLEYVRYSNGSGETVGVYVVRAERGRGCFHPPEYCLLAQTGGSMTEKSIEKIDLGGRRIEATSLVISAGGRKEYVLYWFRTGDDYTSSYYAQQLSLLAGALVRGGARKSVMVRVTTTAGKGGMTAARERVRNLLSAIGKLAGSGLDC